MSVKNLSNEEIQLSKKKQLKRQANELQRQLRQGSAFRTRRTNIIRKLSLILLAVDLAVVPVYLIMAFTVNPIYFIILMPEVVTAGALAAAYLCATPESEIRLKISSYFLVGFLLVDAVFSQWEYGANSGALLLYPFIMVIGALIGLEIVEIIAITFGSILIAATMAVLDLGFNFYAPLMVSEKDLVAQIFLLVLLLLVMMAGVVTLLRSLYQSLGESEQRTLQFIEANHSLTQTAQFGKDASYSLSSIVNELSATSRQQAGGAQEQAAAVMQVTTSLIELGETARQIASNAILVSAAASDGLSSASGVREATDRANTTAARGQNAVDSSIQAIEDVRNGITALAERLMTLTERSRQISSIIGLIKEIADETHLLALNAAIESAGSGQNGRRFAIVASEVKSLADRSLEATTEVSQVINELQGAVAAAVLASEETRKKTFGAVERSYQAGQVITELGLVVDDTATSSTQILAAVEQVATLAEEIRLATQQQESAVRQIISTMDGVGTVAQETASAVSQVSDTINRIDDLSSQLKQVFAANNLLAA